jgi:hypothetical protein
LECANLQVNEIDPDYPRSFTMRPTPKRIAALADLFSPVREMQGGDGSYSVNIAAIAMRRYLRRAWDATEQRDRDWHIYRLREWFWKAAYQQHSWGKARAVDVEELADVPPRLTPVEAVISHFVRSTNRWRHCPSEECPTPYFFATKKGQKYCSTVCALPAQREAKRRWWRENLGK